MTKEEAELLIEAAKNYPPGHGWNYVVVRDAEGKAVGGLQSHEAFRAYLDRMVDLSDC